MLTTPEGLLITFVIESDQAACSPDWGGRQLHQRADRRASAPPATAACGQCRRTQSVRYASRVPHRMH